MTRPVLSAVADERARDLRRAATTDRLGALAGCCRPAAWRALLSGITASGRSALTWMRRGQLGPVDNYCGCP
ncbi:MAG TPA: hypothetical protein VNE21_04050 [Mycobacteriales bacterium]|nr:hypothetical protein [Mycobacteriales bacterium]